MKKSGVLIIGSTGRMGIEILSLLTDDKNLSFVCGLSLEKSDYTKQRLSDIKPTAIDIVIDFSTPGLSQQVAKWCAENKKPFVCGTTGLSDAQFKSIQQASKKIAVLYSANMSAGVAVLKRALRTLSAVKDFDFQIVETHHKKKKDLPSGTAKTLQIELESTIGRKPQDVISIRGGGAFGVHQVLAMGEEETLEFTHTALNRAVFARGAIQAAKFLIKQKPGFYSIENVLEF
jgi:4-hydroxy-tetrahydrodipicolinate reductase